VITEAVLYLAAPDDGRAALMPVARRPVAFRMLMAAVRAGCRRVYVPRAFRDTQVGHLVEATPSARAAVSWLAPGAPAPAAAVLLLPAAALAAPPALAVLAAATPDGLPALGADGDAPAAAVPAAVAETLWPALAEGRPLGDAVARAVKGGTVRPADTSGWYVRVSSEREAREAEAGLYRSLGSAIDTRLDRLLHRRLSRPVTRLALASGIAPNYITLASLVMGLGAAWCFWDATPRSALLGLLLYAMAVVLDHADGEVARLAFRESALGEWLDVAVDTTIHALLVLALGVTASRAAGGAGALGAVAAGGIVASATLAKTSPPPAGPGLGGVLSSVGNRDGFYAMLVTFIVTLGTWPAALPVLMVVVAAGSHGFWLAALVHRLTGAGRPAGR
jgi:phosphatidylglycerophosphate synthase